MNQALLPYKEQELLQQLTDGSGYAFTRIFNHYKSHIYTVSLKFLKSSAAAEEIVQDVFLKVWLKRSELKDVKRLDNYLFIMARNCIFDRVKKMGYQSASQAEMAKLVKNESNADDAEYLLRRHQCEQVMAEAIERLSPQQKQVYCFARQEELSHEAIAEKMGLSKLTVKTHMAKALQSVRRYLDTHLHHLPLLPFTAALIGGH